MTIWVDAQISPRVASWLRKRFSIEAHAVRELGLRDLTGPKLFDAGRGPAVVIMTKDTELVDLVKRLGAPPHIIWINCENTSELGLQEILSEHFDTARALLDSGEPIVEIN